MGTQVGRIEKEFVFKSLIDDQIPIEIHGNMKEFTGIILEIDEKQIIIQGKNLSMDDFEEGEEVRAFFYFKNNYHTFTSRVIKVEENNLVIKHPEGIYKNLQRKYERIKMPEGMFVYFTLKGKKVELNFPRSTSYQKVEEPKHSEEFDPARLDILISNFRKRMKVTVSENKITMFRDKIPRTYEEKVIVKTSKCLWIPSTEDDFPLKDPFPDERIVTKRDLIKFEETLGTPPYIITSKLGNILYEKIKAGIFSELYVPILYNEYIVGYIRLMNNMENKRRIKEPLIDFVWEFSKILCYSLKINGYFKVETTGEKRYEAPIIDMSASGLLFSHTAPELGNELHIHSDIEITVTIRNRKLKIGSRVMRKFNENNTWHFGVQFLRITPEDFRFLFEYLYGKPFLTEYENVWEGGAPPPPLEIFDDQ